MRRFLKNWILPISMLGGVIFHDFIENIRFLTPYLIFLMLVITYTRVSTREFKITRFHWALLSAQMIGSWFVYFLFYFINSEMATGGFMCVFIATATAAPVITGMLGGNVPRIVVYSLLSNLMFALFLPFFLPAINNGVEVEYAYAIKSILIEVVPMLVLPLIIALSLKFFSPRVHDIIVKHQSISFYIWTVALFIVIGSSTNFVINQNSAEIPIMIGLALVSLFVCCLQFYIGRKIGQHFCGDPVAGAQGLGQKNTILAIWIALTYLNPITSIAPASYVAWQNIINSIQLYYRRK